MSSPSKLRVSIGSAAVLGLKKIKTRSKSKTIYLMNSGGCEFSCSFCAQAKCASSRQDQLSRVSWPEFDLRKVLESLQNKQGEYCRICLQVVNTVNIFKTLPALVKQLKKSAGKIKLAVTIRTLNPKDVKAVLNAGADEVGLSIDAASDELFKKIKGGSLKVYKKFILNISDKYPDKIATHLIVGLGETEKEMVELIKELRDHKIIVGLFAFTPVEGSKLAQGRPPGMSAYRRVQIALHLIRNNLPNDIKFAKNGDIKDFGYSKNELYNLLKNSNVFETSGCTDCNRPYYNERAGAQELYNNPEKMEEDRLKRAFRVMGYSK